MAFANVKITVVKCECFADLQEKYLADAKSGPNGPEPTHFREEFRTRGHSNYHHGKQADLAS